MSVVETNSTSIKQQEFELLRKFIEEHCGILLGDEKSYLIESRLAKLLVEHGCSTFSEFYEKLSDLSIPGLRDKVIDAMTTNETLWFRDRTPFDVIRKDILPKYASNPPMRKIRIWSSGCSTGQEPYSLAMTIDQFSLENPNARISLDNVEITATDISPTVLFVANTGRYDSLAIKRGLDEEYRDRYFEKKGRVWAIADTIKKVVTFKKLNLQDSFASLGTFDIVLCRNVMIYFSDEFKKELFGKFASVLRENGSLFLGSAESTLGYSDLFKRRVTDNGVYYQIEKE